MKLGDLDVYELIDALEMERSAWINVLKERRLQDAERVTICVLGAIEGALRKAASTRESRNAAEEVKQSVDIKIVRPLDEALLDGLAKAIGNGSSRSRRIEQP